MLNIIEYQILNSCADDWETFYYPFAEVSYGGQILAAFGTRGQPYQRGYEPREIKILGEIVAGHVRALIHAGLLQCPRVFGDHERAEMTEPEELEFAVYVPDAIGLILAAVGLAWMVLLLYTMAQSPSKQGLHDRIAHTIVVHARRRSS